LSSEYFFHLPARNTTEFLRNRSRKL